MVLITSILTAIGGVVSKALDTMPLIFANQAGKSKAEADIAQNNLETRDKGDIAAQKVDDDLRGRPASDHIRKNDI